MFFYMVVSYLSSLVTGFIIQYVDTFWILINFLQFLSSSQNGRSSFLVTLLEYNSGNEATIFNNDFGTQVKETELKVVAILIKNYAGE